MGKEINTKNNSRSLKKRLFPPPRKTRECYHAGKGGEKGRSGGGGKGENEQWIPSSGTSEQLVPALPSRAALSGAQLFPRRRAGGSCSHVPSAARGLDFPGSAWRQGGERCLTSGAAPGNVLHSSSWQWSGGFQQEGRNSRFQKRKKKKKKN